ncbi:MAG: propanediol utilization phosphotransacylase [Parcubacteria group bacterium Athens1014_10]|nr:MAG: propanediol utilization phosphotransacylase [Parcubacteria group bacterium Athens1014_10]TSD04745.1 MAG: propanediol utilization phosphotransacylase [Parcubacteria group bacterium Athens0714_12]
MKIPIEISAHHLHLCQKDLKILFGKNYQLNVFKPLSQKEQFAAEETVVLANENFKLENVRILGPLRNKTQVEISRTEAVHFGIQPLVKESGQLKESIGGLKIIGPNGTIELKEGIIIALRHIHASPTDALKYKVEDRQIVSVKVEGERALIFYKVVVRVDPLFVWNLHLDTDEANAAGLKGGEEGEMLL